MINCFLIFFCKHKKKQINNQINKQKTNLKGLLRLLKELPLGQPSGSHALARGWISRQAAYNISPREVEGERATIQGHPQIKNTIRSLNMKSKDCQRNRQTKTDRKTDRQTETERQTHIHGRERERQTQGWGKRVKERTHLRFYNPEGFLKRPFGVLKRFQLSERQKQTFACQYGKQLGCCTLGEVSTRNCTQRQSYF